MDTTNLRVHKVRLCPNNFQRNYLERCAGTARFSYNWALATWRDWYAQYKAGQRAKAPTHREVRNHLTSIKRTEFPWMLDVSKCIPQEAIAHLGMAYANAFAGRAAFPEFKRKGRSRDSFKITGDHITITADGHRGSLVRIAKCPGSIRMREPLRWDGRVVSVTFSRTAGQWYASVLIEVADRAQLVRPVTPTPRPVLGVDVGVREFATSDGQLRSLPRSYRAGERKLRRLQQTVARRHKGSVNRAKAQARVARQHHRVACRRQDFLHQLTTELVHDNQVIVIEDLNVKGMARNRHLAKSVHDAAFGEFRRQLTYKVDQAPDRSLVVADRWFASSKTCSVCGAKTKHLPLSVREWTCPSCGTVHHRDLNAAVNLEHYHAVGSTVSACGQLFTSVAAPCGVEASGLDEAGIEHHRLSGSV